MVARLDWRLDPSIDLVTVMQDLWYLFLIAAFAALTFGIAAACAALGARR